MLLTFCSEFDMLIMLGGLWAAHFLSADKTVDFNPAR